MASDPHSVGADSSRPKPANCSPAQSFINLWLEAALHVDALQAQVAYLERAWLRAEADADYWYFQACRRHHTRGHH